ncbi:hypothetical protein MCC01971_05990 [Bifidobacteriaceae bacterium MCC01971]|nr:hypothetical protein MCC01971_05990 [Bifidobacteriaceae bacterium MCC01971]
MTTSSVSPVTTELAGSETGITLVVHAGAGSRGKRSTPERIAQVELDLQRALDAGYQLLESGAPAHEAVVAAHQVSDRVRFSGENVEDAATATLDEVAAHHGDGGMIVLPAVGRGNETMFHWFAPVTYGIRVWPATQ